MKIISLVNSRNFQLRVASAMVLLPLAVLVVVYGGKIFQTAIIVLTALLAMEWQQMLDHGVKQRKKIYQVIGLFYIALPMLALIDIRQHNNGLEILLWMLLAVISTDVGAYFFGMLIGGPKIAPSISPNKSWAGLAGGIIMTLLFSYTYYAHYQALHYLVLAPAISVISQMGDFTESAWKRHFNCKDSSDFIPGHGGFFDRMDSIITAAVFVWLML